MAKRGKDDTRNYEHIPGLRTQAFVLGVEESYVQHCLGQDEDRIYVLMQAVVNENNRFDVSVVSVNAALKDGEVRATSWGEMAESRWSNLPLDKAVTLLETWQGAQERAPYDGPLVHENSNRDAVTPLAEADLAALAETLKTSRQSPNEIAGEKTMNQKDKLTREFSYVAAKKDRQTGLYALEDRSETHRARGRLRAAFNFYRHQATSSVQIENGLTHAQAVERLRTARPGTHLRSGG